MTPSPLPNSQTPPMPMQPEGVGYPSGTGNPVLDEISAAHANLSPQAQQAIEGAHEMVGLSPEKHSDPALAASTAPSPEVAVPGVSGPRGPLPNLSPEIPVPASSMGSYATGGTPMADGGDMADAALGSSNATFAAGHAASPSGGSPMAAHQISDSVPSALQRERSRITAPPLPGSDPNAHTSMDTGRSGVQQIHNPWLRGLATVGDVLASGVFPRFGQFIPGTTGYHNNLVAGNERAIEGEQASAKNAVDVAHTQAGTAEELSLPELHKTQAELAAEKLHSTETAKDADRAIKQAEEDRKTGADKQKIEQHLRDTGYKYDDNGAIVPVPYEEMTVKQKQAHDTLAAGQSLRESQAELADARAAYVKAQKDGIPAAQEVARKRVAAAQQNAATAAGRLGLSRDNFNAEFLGTAPGGEALAGGETDENGKPIGTKVAAGNKPGATVQGRASQAGSIIEVGNNLKFEIDKHKDALGNLSDYWKQATNGTPIADPVASKLMSEIASYAALQPAMHGMRGGQVMKEFEKMVGGIPKDPEALKAAIDGIGETAAVIKKQGQPAHTGSGSGAQPKPTTQAEYDAIKPGTVYVDTDGQQKKKK